MTINNLKQELTSKISKQLKFDINQRQNKDLSKIN